MSEEILRLKPNQVRELIKRGEMEMLSTPERAKEILGKDFLGVEAVKNLENGLRKTGVNVDFVIDNLPPFFYTEEDLLAARASGEMLVLRPEEMIRDGIKQPVTLIEFRELFQEDPLGKLQSIHRKDHDKYKKDWHKGNKFSTSAGEIKLGWSLVKKEVLDGSANKNWNDQEQLLQKYAEDLKLKGAKHIFIRRRTALEKMYDTLLYYVNTGERLLANIGDRGETLEDGGNIVSLIFRSDGLAVYHNGLMNTNPYEGVCPSRPVEIVKPNDIVSLEKAQQIFGKDFMGPGAFTKAFFGRDVNANYTPPEIPFTLHELERAKELNQFLILRFDKTHNQKPLTMQKMEQLLQDRFNKEGKGRVLLNTKFWTTAWVDKNEDFFKKDIPRVGWALVSKDVIPESIGKTYLQQTAILAGYLANSLTGNISARRRFFPEISEFNAQRDVIPKISDTKEVARRLSDLKLNQATRHTPVEALYDLLVYFENTGQRLLENTWTCTSKCHSEGKFILMGGFQPRGIRINYTITNEEPLHTGVCFSRRF